MAWRLKNTKHIRKLKEAKTALTNRSDYLQLKYMDISSLAKSKKNKYHQTLLLKRAQQVQQLSNNALENAFIIDGLIDSINSLKILINADVQQILKGLCTAAIEDAMTKASVAMESVQDIVDIVAQPLLPTDPIDDNALHDFITSDDTNVIQECSRIYQKDFPLPPTTSPTVVDKYDRNSLSINRLVTVGPTLNSYELETI